MEAPLSAEQHGSEPLLRGEMPALPAHVLVEVQPETRKGLAVMNILLGLLIIIVVLWIFETA